MKSIYRTLIIFLVLWTGLLLITFNKHIKREPYTYHSEIWSDKAGYYVYLPATFIYNWQGHNMPDAIGKKTGRGFKVVDNYIITKYPMGMAVMMAPFWLINHYFIANPNDGFSFSYTLVSSVSATFYVLLGLFISYACYKKYTTSKSAILLACLLFASSNLFYYTVKENGMSHSFSFFWFALLLFVLLDIKQRSYAITSRDTLLLGITIGFIMLIRPVNCIFCLPYFLILVINNPNAKLTIKELLFTAKSTFLYILPAIIFAPQLFYYKLTSVIKPAYSGEGFRYLTHPKIPEVLFAPNNGLFLYTPIVFFIFIFLFINRKKIPFIVPICTLFCLVVYTYASWWSPQLGCGFGHRSMVEFYSLIFLPLTYLNISRKIKITFIFIIALCILYNIKLSLSYDGCFEGDTYWDWNAYLTFLFSNIN